MRKNELRVHTVFKGEEKIDTHIFTLREGLSSMIKRDFDELHPSRLHKRNELQKTEVEAISPIEKFDGTMLERLIKSYCFSKRKLVEKGLETAISSFLSSFLKFGQIYKYEDFKDKLVKNFIDSLNSGLPENHEDVSVDILISDELLKFERTHINHKLDGLAWIEDLNPILKEVVNKFVNML